MLITLNPSILEKTLHEAENSPRRRAIHCFHKPEEILQRMINAGCSDTYVQPHKHDSPDKVEVFSILYGKVAVFTFNDAGGIESSILLAEEGKNKIAEIPPKTWHGLVIMSPRAVVYEIINGKYDPREHKSFAPWAPAENSPQAQEYLARLKEFSPDF